MTKNVGNTDKIIRYVLAVVALYFAYTCAVASPWNYLLYVVALIMVVTAVTGVCPLFSLFGINTCKIKK
ncbi:YgaP family membrane protein [Namhaeicola litoreus]|uniref:DUF2892 domain-containing protein n=1 Tax=Namhaeicola litoreus TaxID=1052145 RepID=A0ABW3Y1I9_9FLAO